MLTYVGQYDEGLALGAVRRELLREGQVFWVHNRVATIERQAAWLQEQVPDARIVVAHGQMDEDMLERRMIRFWDREADILMSTVIIESGLDVPNANTLVVDAANLLGLSQMYQLRGRVGAATSGRSRTSSSAASDGGGARAAHDDRAAPGARQRVPDRAPRPGDPGSWQRPRRRAARPHRGGGIRHVRAVAPRVGREMRGEPLPEEKEIRIDLPLRAFVPPGWLEQEALRLDLYRRISSAGDHGLLERVRTETVDRFGQLPEEVETLFAVASLRITCARLGVGEVSTYRQQVRIKPLELPEALEHDLADRVEGARYLRTTATRTSTRVPVRAPVARGARPRPGHGRKRGRCYDDPVIPSRVPFACSRSCASPCCSRRARTIRRRRRPWGREISIDQLHGGRRAVRLPDGPLQCTVDAGRERDPGGGLCRFALANDIREELAKAYATENDLQVDPADVTDALSQLEQGLGGADALKSQLSDAGVTRPEVEAFAARLLLVNAVQQAVVKERLDEAALRDAYQANLAQFTTLEVGHILVADEADAERIAADVTPATFAQTAKRESIDQQSAAQGGSLGSFSVAQFQTQFDPDFVAATLALSRARSPDRSRRSSAGT